jgi:hypothetical protein
MRQQYARLPTSSTRRVGLTAAGAAQNREKTARRRLAVAALAWVGTH